MNMAQLGQVAGIGGIAVGGAVLVFRQIMQKALIGVPRSERARVVSKIAVCAFGIAVVGIGVWGFDNFKGSPSVMTHGDRSPAVVSGRDANVSVGSDQKP